MRVLIVEDNQELADFIRLALRDEGYATDNAANGTQAVNLMSVFQYDAVILDLGLPDFDGLQLIRQVRKVGNTVPVLIVTARGGINDRIKGLDLGADDYLNKPFAIGELIARLRAILRRPNSITGMSINMKRGKLLLDPKSKRVVAGENNITMGKTEFALLEYMLRHATLTVSKEALFNAIYSLGFEVTDNAIQVAVHRVRKKLEQVNAEVTIKTIRGIGYILI
ncbi:response regulator transcription factor [Pseudoalteromonas arctica]|uniref:Response regulator transcription factor n=1 Tax=Pseudoalteromonas arctica TaxID=394751 RepID=A0A7Y0DVN2_9GAMM|nr:response regulator transcription factor [Pseudoalteromonas arctica]NMM42463.1 response regulator transcription factor [Pseudoalteromonas arctica]